MKGSSDTVCEGNIQTLYQYPIHSSLSFSLHASLLWKVTSSHCRAKKRWRGKVLLSESLRSCGQVTRSASACIYLTRTVSSLQESVVENTGIVGLLRVIQPLRLGHSTQLTQRGRLGGKNKVRRLLTEEKKNSIGFLDNPDFQKKKSRDGQRHRERRKQ